MLQVFFLGEYNPNDTGIFLRDVALTELIHQSLKINDPF